jgi:NAD(P)-dependent dehydrogenase (short-subunit alcohol dehydrogenase family)
VSILLPALRGDELTEIEIAAYSASKAAVIAMTRADAIDYSEKDIRVNCICPGIIATPMTTYSEERIELLKPAIDIAPMKRMGTVNEVADCALFLASTQASFVQGHAMVVDKGYVIN